MNKLFVLSYILAFGVIVVESLVLRAVLQKTMWLQRFYNEPSHSSESNDLDLLESSVPEFSLPSLEADRMVTTTDLKGWPSILCFVSPQLARSNQSLMSALHAWWHKMEKHVYLVCGGSEGACRDFVRSNANGFPLGSIVCDEGGVLARAFRVYSSPQSVELDKNGRVKRYGRPEGLESEIRNGREGGNRSGEAAGQTAWPDDRPMSGAGFARVDTTMSCVLSRFRLNSPLSLIPFYLAFKRVRREARTVGGLLEAAFLLEGLRTCYTLSLWRDDWSIVEFGRVRAHIDAANSVFGDTYRKDLKRAEIWSAQFRLWAVSSHNLNWDGLDMQAALGEQWHRRAEVGRMTNDGEE